MDNKYVLICLSCFLLIILTCSCGPKVSILEPVDKPYFEIVSAPKATKTKIKNEQWKPSSFNGTGELKELWRHDFNNKYHYDYKIDDLEYSWVIQPKKDWTPNDAELDVSKRWLLDPKTGQLYNTTPHDIYVWTTIDQKGIGFNSKNISYYKDDTSRINNYNDLVCWDISNGKLLWSIQFEYYEFYQISSSIYLLSHLWNEDEQYWFITRIDPDTGDVIWKIKTMQPCMQFKPENVLNSYQYLWLKSINIVLSFNADQTVRFDPSNLDIQKINIKNKWGVCVLNNYICIANGTTLTLADMNTGFVEITYDLKNYIKDINKKLRFYSTKDYFVIVFNETSSTGQDDTIKILRIDPNDQNNPLIIDISKLSNEELTPLKYNNEEGIPFYYESNKEIYYIDDLMGQKTWWIRKSTGIKKIYIIESRGILAYVEKDDFKGLVCFGQK